MIGQDALLAKLRLYTINTFPRSVMLIGEKGCGKHMVTDIIKSEILKPLPLIDITTLISDEYLDEIYRNPNPSIYLIDLSAITEKSQNTILKFVEEPSNNAFIILLAEHRNLVLNTVLNRCIIFEFEQYTKAQLMQFTENHPNSDIITDILRTPGKLLYTNFDSFAEALGLADKIIKKINIASYPNTLSIASKVNYKDEYDKINVETMFDLLCFTMLSEYKRTHDITILKMYQLTAEHRKSLLDKRLNKQLHFENYLSKLWQLSRGI